MSDNLSLPRRYAATAVFFLAVLATWGAINRGKLAGIDLLPVFSFTAMMHAHSHVAYFGWASLAIMSAVLAHLAGALGLSSLPHPRLAGLNLILIAVTTMAAWAAFTVQGYAPASIVLSSINVLWWYVFAWLVLDAWRRRRRAPGLAAQFFLVATAFLVISSLGAWTRAAMIGLKITDALPTDGAVYFYLHNFTEGFLVLGAMGAAYWLLPRLTGQPVLNEWLARVQLTLAAVFILPTFLVELYADGLPSPWNYIGGTFQLLMFLPNSLFIYNMAAALHRSPTPSLTLRFIQLAIAAFGIKTGLDLARAVEPLALALGGRQLIVAYLHLTLLGFLSMLLMGMVYDLLEGPRSARAGIWHFALVALGTWGMILGLFGAGAAPLFGLVTPAGPRFWMWLALAFAWVSAAGIYVFALNLRFYPGLPGMLSQGNSRGEKGRAQPISIQER